MLERSQKDVWRLGPWLAIPLLLANFGLMAFDARTASNERVIRVWTQTVANFIQSPVSKTTDSVAGFFQSIASLRSAQTENDSLRQRIQELEFRVQENVGLAEENQRLRGLLELKNGSSYRILPAKVIGRDTSAWFDTVIIGRGTLDGVQLNNPIINDGGLIGRVTAVSPLTAQVTLITKSKSGVGGVVGELQGSSAIGVVFGNGSRETLDMGYVPGSVPLNIGDPVYTTGQDGIFPAGLKIGEVLLFQPGSTTEPHKITLKVTSNLHNLQEVAIVLFRPDERPSFERSVPNASQEVGKKQ